MIKKNILFVTTCLASAYILSSCKSSQKIPTTQPKSIVILYDNDVHCNIDGYAKIAGLRDLIKDTADVTLVSCGDFLQGGMTSTLSKGKYIVDVMKPANYDIVTLGNHEFDFGTPHMMQLLKELNVPVTCVNFKEHKTGEAPYAPYIIKKYGEKKIAFIGVSTPTAITSERYAFFDENDDQLYNMSENDIYPLVQKTIDEVRKQGVDYVIILSHLGEKPTEYNIDSRGLIANTHGIDVVFDGHTHSIIEKEMLKNQKGELVLLSQTGTKFKNIGKCVILPNGKFHTELVPTKEIKDNAIVKSAIDSINNLSEEYVNKVIGNSDFDIRISDENGKRAVRRSETNAGDIIADAFRILVGSDIGMTDGGSVRADIKAGDIKIKDVLNVLPYDNYIYELEVDGKHIEKVLNACIQKLPNEDGEFPIVSGLKFNIKIGQGENKVSDIKVLNKKSGEYEPIDFDAKYTVATIDYIAVGGGMYNTLKGCKILRKDLIVDKDALIEYISKNQNGHVGQEYAKPQGRIKFIQ